MSGQALCRKVEAVFSRPGGAQALGKQAKAMAITDANQRIYQLIRKVLS